MAEETVSDINCPCTTIQQNIKLHCQFVLSNQPTLPASAYLLNLTRQHVYLHMYCPPPLASYWTISQELTDHKINTKDDGRHIEIENLNFFHLISLNFCTNLKSTLYILAGNLFRRSSKMIRLMVSPDPGICQQAPSRAPPLLSSALRSSFKRKTFTFKREMRSQSLSEDCILIGLICILTPVAVSNNNCNQP